MVGVESSSRFRIFRRWRLWLVSSSVLLVLMVLFQNCGRMKSSVQDPDRIYSLPALQMLADLSEAQKTSLCQSAANYQCQRLRVDAQLLDRDLAEMVCLKHEAFPKRVCIQTQYFDRAQIDPSLACQQCTDPEGESSPKAKPITEYSCYNSALKVRTMVEHRLYGSTLEEALTQAYFACRASVSF